jgi:hypothetical protein
MNFFKCFSAVLIAASCSSQAVMIGPFPGLQTMIEEADAIAIVRIEEGINASGVIVDGITTHRCFIYQSLKGDLPKSQRVTLKLIGTRSSFGDGSTHLAFLSTNASRGESVIHNLHYEGSIFRLSPFGHEALPIGPTLERRIKLLLESSISYWDGEQQREKELLLAAITGMSPPLRRQLEKAHKNEWEDTERKKSVRISPDLDFDGITASALLCFQTDGKYWTIQINLFSKGQEDIEKEKPPTVRAFNSAGLPVKVDGDSGYSEIDNLFVMYRVDANSLEDIADVEVEFKGIKRRFRFRQNATGGDEAKERHELPRYGAIPDLDQEWALREKRDEGAPEKGTSWLVFTNSQNGDFLSISADRLGDKAFPKVNRVPWSDMAGDRFPGGYPWNQLEGQMFAGHWIRNEVVNLSAIDTNRNTNVVEQALEYTIIFEGRKEPSRMAHGYALPLGRCRLLVQHTSTNVITPEFANTLASRFLSEHLNGGTPLTGK